jgi:hypothetical protein
MITWGPRVAGVEHHRQVDILGGAVDGISRPALKPV